jgi:hypothetical protein
MAKDLLNACSRIGPKTTPRTMGGCGILSLCMAYPTIPKVHMIHKSKMEAVML